MIFTSYFEKLRELPPNFVPIAICRYPPSEYRGLTYKALAPPSYLIDAWTRHAITEREYIPIYGAERLNRLNPHTVVGELTKLTDGNGIVLLCHERPNDFCHRHLVADWLNRAGYECEELAIFRGGIYNDKEN